MTSSLAGPAERHRAVLPARPSARSSARRRITPTFPLGLAVVRRGAAAGYTTFGVGELVRGYRTLGVMNLIFAALWGLLFSIGLWMWRRRRSRTEAEDGPAAGRSPEAGPDPPLTWRRSSGRPGGCRSSSSTTCLVGHCSKDGRQRLRAHRPIERGSSTGSLRRQTRARRRQSRWRRPRSHWCESRRVRSARITRPGSPRRLR